jgi:hypothetical protein
VLADPGGDPNLCSSHARPFKSMSRKIPAGLQQATLFCAAICLVSPIFEDRYLDRKVSKPAA